MENNQKSLKTLDISSALEEPSFKKNPWESFQKHFDEIGDPAEKVRYAIDFMRATISQKGQPRFKDFWEAKKICLHSFKDVDNPILRANLWNEYLELTNEAKRLKEILDEQSSFAIEQIELAIQALIADLEDEAEKIKALPRVEFPKEAQTLKDREKIYNQKQLLINFLQTMAQRVQALRKETIETEMRIRHKNRLLQKLSKIGDLVFPRRKQLILEISQSFLEDVEKFASENFSEASQPGIKEGGKSVPLFVLKEEIKAFQKMAKVLSLSTECFTKSRKLLSDCFEAVKKKEKQRKQEYAEMKESCKENFETVYQKIKDFEQWINSAKFTKEALEAKGAEILNFMKNQQLVRDQIKTLRDEFLKQKKSAERKLHELEKEVKQKSLEEENRKKEQVQSFFQDFQQKLAEAENNTSEEIAAAEQKFKSEAQGFLFTPEEEIRLHLMQEDLYQCYLEKKQKENAAAKMEPAVERRKWEDLLEENEDFRERIKNRLEEFRRLSGSSGLDFEKAILYRECMERERTRFEELSESMEVIEEYLAELEV
ncbi:MAG: hypothetical protein Tsb0015_00510 [Simkaniaceae bacterium]